MSGDNAPGEIVKGAITGCKEHGVDGILVGEKAVIESIASENGLDLTGFEIVDAPGPHVTMEDQPADVMSPEKKDSSMAVALDLLKNGGGDGLVSAGNTGALLTGATLKVRRIKGVRRAALGAILPIRSPQLLMDSGAQTDCSPENLVLFAKMGSLYMEKVMKVENPKVALINNEGREIFNGEMDVLVTDGFTGNIVLKMCEGAGKFVKYLLNRVFRRSIFTKIGYLLVKKDIKNIQKEMDYSEYGGAPFLGISKPVIKAHGSSKAKSLAVCIRQARDYAESGMISEIEKYAAAAKSTPAAE